MFTHLALAFLIALATGTVVLVVPVPFLGSGTRMRTGLGRRARTIVLPRPRRGRLATLWADLVRAVLGDTRGPVGPALIARQPTTEGISRLRWLLLHAGYGHRSVAWLRRQQVKAMLAALLLGSVVPLALGLAPVTLLLLVPPALLVGYHLPLLALRRLAATRRARLRIELVTFLYGLAALVVRGRPVERALDRLALRPGELAREVAFARELHVNGVPMAEALEVLAARCGSEEVREAMSLIAATLGGAVPLERAAAMFKDLAGSVRVMIDEKRREELAYAVLRATALGTVLGLPIVAVTLLYPILATALRTFLGGGA